MAWRTALFRDRREAGERLAPMVRALGLHEPIVYALLRAGAAVAAPVAAALGVPRQPFLVRKLGVPWHPELAFGALAEGEAEPVLNADIIRDCGLDAGRIAEVQAAQARELARRQAVYLRGRARPDPRGRPAVLVDDGHVITQSMAIMEYLEERWPTRAVLPKDSLGRARVRALAQLFVSDIQPLHNLRVLRYLRHRQGQDEAQVKQWSAHWIAEGLMAAEHLLASGGETGTYCHGEHPTIADACLIPELHEAIEQGVDLSAFPVARRIYATCMTLAAFQAAAPETQRDAAGLSVTDWA